MPQLSLSLTVNGKTETCDCPDEACLGECLEDFYATLADLARDPNCHKSSAANCPGGKGKELTISWFARLGGEPYSSLLLIVGDLSEADLKAAEKALGDCCTRMKAKAGKP